MPQLGNINNDFRREKQIAREHSFEPVPLSGSGWTQHGDMRDEWFCVQHKSTIGNSIPTTVGALRKAAKDARESGLFPLFLFDFAPYDELWVAIPFLQATEFSNRWLERERALAERAANLSHRNGGDSKNVP